MHSVGGHEPDFYANPLVKIDVVTQNVCRRILTRRSLLEESLNLCGQLDDVVWRTGPNHQAVALIVETRLYLGVLKAKEALVNHELLVLRREELFLLKSVAFGAMSLIQSLEFLLYGIS
jgi:hypothetical protein